jgi:hypothetical protein
MNLSLFNQPALVNWNTDQMELYLTQQGFFHEEITVPASHSGQMEQLISVVKEYYQNKKEHQGHKSEGYVDLVSRAILHRPLIELDEQQRQVLRNFMDLLGNEA